MATILKFKEHDEVSDAERRWTVKASDGLTHRAIRQLACTPMYVITLCDWWQTHNVHGERAPVRTDTHPSCLACVALELGRLAP